jgi:hypothetical protein
MRARTWYEFFLLNQRELRIDRKRQAIPDHLLRAKPEQWITSQDGFNIVQLSCIVRMFDLL